MTEDLQPEITMNSTINGSYFVGAEYGPDTNQ
jgi:hypothetical protein